jgi:hypothetical protein
MDTKDKPVDLPAPTQRQVEILPNPTQRQVEGMSEEPPTPEGPTDSHVLAQVDQDEKGLAQKAGDIAGVTDVGWTTPVDHIDEPLVAGISNEDLWMLLRRFDQASLNKLYNNRET